MMMSELFALLTSGATPLTQDARGTSRNKITPDDIAGCLIHADRHCYLYGLRKFCLDQSTETELNALARQAALSHGFTCRDSEPIDGVSRLAVLALKFSVMGSRCGSCSGTGNIASKNKVDTCDRCEGSGNANLSVRRLADVIGTGRWRAQKVWMPRFQLLLSDYQIMDDALNTMIHRGLRDG